MARKKNGPLQDAAAHASSDGLPTAQQPGTRAASTKKPAQQAHEPSTSALIICRNKHWRYISSFHGPWLQLPPEVLESLAHTNYLSQRPHPIDPAVFYDLVKIRKNVEEATNLAVRATSGLTSAALSNSLSASHGMLGSAAALGLGYNYGGGGGNAKLSRERKHRMRELATAKLSQAYRLDEIAASVATMQSASTLENVAQLVLQRNPNDVEAKYVHFFHEKIPSRMMAQCTPLEVLDSIVAERPSDGSPLRTRALTRIFKEDYVNAAKDLTEGLSRARYMLAQHRAGKDQLVLAKPQQEFHARDWREIKVAEEDQPSSLETQLLFHRAGVYFTIACQHVHAALDGLREAEEAKARREAQEEAGEEPTPETPAEQAARHNRLEARKQVRANAKRAIRDYTAFLSHFDYTPGISPEVAEALLRHLNATADEPIKGSEGPVEQHPDPSSPATSTSTSEALIPHRRTHQSHHQPRPWPKLDPPEVFKVSELFEPAAPASLPPYPPLPDTPSSPFAESQEAITYHPLLTDALHSLLLCHALTQTPPKELLRHAHNAARLARICDGYPIFLAARSPARADWIEVLRRTGNWIGLKSSWESLCRPAPLPGQGGRQPAHKASTAGRTTDVTVGGKSSDGVLHGAREETAAQKRERQKHEAILEALADERVVDEDSFQRAVRAREQRFREDEELDAKNAAANGVSSIKATEEVDATATANGTDKPKLKDPGGLKAAPPPKASTSPYPSTPAPKRWAQDDGREYPISTERAEAISRWVREAPLSGSNPDGAGPKKTRKKGKRKVNSAGKGEGSSRAASSAGLENSVEGLDIEDDEGLD
ncbi:uncharacterized protein EI97DRAFT_499549 [Westerdykella ornata]|uniref:Uncharacterized protein n=1 Tax=Westerdykella ornata TaxID=318751 RepID=A0A6A6JQZ5_WESOR|nr:uncharacterized protein EI97DRAFT_499549 [Westerdykella ornata]KAF2279051.1 hypothetical protein EI97DRAFT_499549 [Westerdykella ornata]